MRVSEGQLLAGKYRVERVLGRGGMGVVVAAHHVVLDQVVAIKLLLPEALASAEAVARFEREARAAAKIQSEHVARVMDVGRLENRAPYMVMELLRGRDLEILLREQGPLSLADVADYVLQAGEAIAEAHGLGIVHRDLKPSNLFLTLRADGSSCVKVLDFGISKLTVAGSNEQGMTSTAAIMGSPLYMSPEQLMSARDVDMRADIWSLGVICFELLTGKPPFLADTLPQLCMAISLGKPTPVRNYRPDLPLEVETILLRCLTKDPGKRYANISQLANELVRFAPTHARLSAERIERLARAAGFPASALALPLPSGGEVVAVTRSGAGTIAEFGRTKPGAASSRVRLGVVLGAVLAAAGGGPFLLRRPAIIPGAPPLVSAAATAPHQAVAVIAATAPQERAVATIPPPVDGEVAAPPSSSSRDSQSPGSPVSAAKPRSARSITASKTVVPSKTAVPKAKPPAVNVAVPSATAPVTAPTFSPRSRL